MNLTRTSELHIGSGAIESIRSSMKSSTNMIDGLARKETGSFEQSLLAAFDKVNTAQQESDAIAQQLIVDPDSVDVHDVTIAMAEASLSLSIAQNVIDRIIKGWTEVTTSR